MDGKVAAWKGLVLTPDSHTGKNAGKIILPPGRSYVDLMSDNFKVSPGAEYYVDFWIKKDAGCRVIPMIVFFNPGNPADPVMGFFIRTVEADRHRSASQPGNGLGDFLGTQKTVCLQN